MIGPKNSFITWRNEFEICFKDKLTLKIFNVQDKKFKNKTQKINALRLDSANVNLYLFNYESLKSLKDEIKHIIDGNTLLIFDEVHRIKNPNGEQASYSLEISKYADYIITMTGTPIPNSYTDIYNLLHINYNDEYKDFFGFQLSTLKNPNSQDIKIINKKLSPFFCRTSKENLGVPLPNEDNIINVK